MKTMIVVSVLEALTTLLIGTHEPPSGASRSQVFRCVGLRECICLMVSRVVGVRFGFKHYQSALSLKVGLKLCFSKPLWLSLLAVKEEHCLELPCVSHLTRPSCASEALSPVSY